MHVSQAGKDQVIVSRNLCICLMRQSRRGGEVQHTCIGPTVIRVIRDISWYETWKLYYYYHADPMMNCTLAVVAE